MNGGARRVARSSKGGEELEVVERGQEGSGGVMGGGMGL